MNHEIHDNWNPTINNDFTVYKIWYEIIVKFSEREIIVFRQMLNFDEMMMMSTLYLTNTLSWIFVALKQQSAGRHIILILSQ